MTARGTPGYRRIRATDSLKKTKRGKNAAEKVRKIRIAALRANNVASQTLKQIEKKNADRPLTDKQRMFVRYWAGGETPRTAALMAGYSPTSEIGWTLSNDPAILKIYREEKRLYEEANGHTKKRVMSMLQEAYDHAKLVSEPATMVAAARELGKMAGHYEPEKLSINVNVGGKLFDRLASLSDEQLLKIMEEKGDVIMGEATRIIDEAELLPRLTHEHDAQTA